MVRVTLGEGISEDNLEKAVLAKRGGEVVFVELGTSNPHPLYCPFLNQGCDSSGVSECLNGLGEGHEFKNTCPSYTSCEKYSSHVESFVNLVRQAHRA